MSQNDEAMLDQNTGLTPEQVERVFTNYIIAIEKLFDEHAVESARSVLEIYKREFGIDLVAKNPNAEALLTNFIRRQFDDVLLRAAEKLIRTEI